MIKNSIQILGFLFIVLIIAQCAPNKEKDKVPMDQSLKTADMEAIKNVRKNYTEAWLAGNPSQIMALLTEDAVLIPHHGDMPIEGTQAIKEFWWPADALPSKVTTFTSTMDEVDGHGDTAFVRGRFTLVFTYGNQTYSNEGNYLNVMKKSPKGNWKLARLIWNDPVATVE